jgi:hypothetical protein
LAGLAILVIEGHADDVLDMILEHADHDGRLQLAATAMAVGTTASDEVLERASSHSPDEECRRAYASALRKLEEKRGRGAPPPIQVPDPEWEDDGLKRASEDPEAHWVTPPLPAAVYLRDAGTEESISVRRVIALSADTFLVESETHPGDWYLGEQDDRGVVRCWGRYGTLRQALWGL